MLTANHASDDGQARRTGNWGNCILYAPDCAFIGTEGISALSIIDAGPSNDLLYVGGTNNSIGDENLDVGHTVTIGSKHAANDNKAVAYGLVASIRRSIQCFANNLQKKGEY